MNGLIKPSIPELKNVIVFPRKVFFGLFNTVSFHLFIFFLNSRLKICCHLGRNLRHYELGLLIEQLFVSSCYFFFYFIFFSTLTYPWLPNPFLCSCHFCRKEVKIYIFHFLNVNLRQSKCRMNFKWERKRIICLCKMMMNFSNVNSKRDKKWWRKEEVGRGEIGI